MKNIFYSIFALCTVLMVVSCGEKENLHVYKGDQVGHFLTTSYSYFVEESNDPGFEVGVGVPSVAGSDITYNVVVDESSTAVEGTDFTLGNSSVTIPSGGTTGTVKINGDFTSLSAAAKTIVLNLESASGSQVATFDNSATVLISKFCPYVPENFVGTWTIVSGFHDATVEREVVVGDGAGELKVVSFFADGSDVVLKMDDPNKANFTVAVDKQLAWVSGQYGDASVAGEGTFSACNNTISLALEHTVAAGSFGVIAEEMSKN